MDGEAIRIGSALRRPETMAVDTQLPELRFECLPGKAQPRRRAGWARDQAPRLAQRLLDQDNYYIVRANALEGNVVLYKVEKGKRTDLDPKGSGAFAYGKKAAVPTATWGTLRVVVRGKLFETYLNGEKLFEVEDATFAGAGKVGVWTKADSVTHFDELTLKVLR
jgi:hypothetical protein